MKYTVKIKDREYEVQIDDLQARPICTSVNGEAIEVWPEEKSQPASTQPASPAQTSSVASSKQVQRKPVAKQGVASNAVNAPIPGLIIHIAVKPGDQVEFGQELCTLEAMKMKNAIRSGQQGTIDQVLVSVGDQVSQNQPLMTYQAGEA